MNDMVRVPLFSAAERAKATDDNDAGKETAN
jgi:hypothetical protein